MNGGARTAVVDLRAGENQSCPTDCGRVIVRADFVSELNRLQVDGPLKAVVVVLLKTNDPNPVSEI